MDCAVFKQKIKECKTYAELEPTLKEALISTSGLELARTAYQIQKAQPDLANHFFSTVIREAEEKVKEASDEVGGTNRADPLPTLGKKTPDGGEPDTGATGTEDQMKENIMGMLDPSIATQMMPQQLPGMTMPQQIKQMQYTVKKMMGPYVEAVTSLKKENIRLKEAVIKIDEKLQEALASKTRTMPLEIPGRVVKETRIQEIGVSTPHKSLEDKRYEMAELDRMLNDGQISTADIYG